MLMSWLFLFIGIVLELGGTTCMKLSEGFSRILPSVAMILFYMSSLGMLTLALKHIPLNVAYAIWSGLGTLLVVILGMVWFHEAVSLPKLASILLIILGVIGVRLSGT
jgi:small multidrug resistance pump